MRRAILSLATIVGLVAASQLTPGPSAMNGDPVSVTIAGSLQSELGCPGDWQADCAETHLTYDGSDDVWQQTFPVPAGSWEYKATLDDSWTVNYGLNATQNGANIPLDVSAATPVKFYYDHKTHWITSNTNSIIAVAPGSFQSELGCAGDWDPGCLRSWLQDPDGDGIYSFTTGALPPGSYEAKVAIDESWNENYGAGGVPGGANIPFSVGSGAVTFSYNASTHVLTISGGSSPDNNVVWDGLRHDSRDPLYRSPGGAVLAGTPVVIRFRTFHNDVTSVVLRVYDVDAASQKFLPMAVAASDTSCYQPGLEMFTCDLWQVTLERSTPDNLWYRFVVTDGTNTVYYADNTAALDGGLGATSAVIVDNSYALMYYVPSFAAPAWARDSVIYQVFPDRFRNGRKDNDARTGEARYDDPVVALPWGTLPEGYCRNYADAATNCPWRFDTTPPAWSPAKEQPRGRDYFGGDLKGLDQQLDYLQSLGATAIYLNPIFDAASNHGYDTQDYYRIDPYLGTAKDWESLVKHAGQRRMRLMVDGVFNHLSSDSFFFDRYRRFATVGACEAAASPYRQWFSFRAPSGSEPSPCAPGTLGGTDTYYNGWFGFDSIPVLTKSLPEVQQYFVTGPASVARYWLQQGASSWRLDVMGDSSFPNGYWESFRTVVKQTKPDSLIVGELWQKDSMLLRHLRGDRADATMNYRLRDAVIGLLAPGSFDSKGFADSGRVIAPSEFVSRLESIREDYPTDVYFSLMNLLDSHDTERLLWTLTPGTETEADKENPTNLQHGKRMVKLASMIQFFVPGAPTIYYGDEVGVTGDDDPDDRRTYPWGDLGGTPDMDLFAHYQSLIALRRQTSALTSGNFRTLLADDAAGSVVLGRKTDSQAAVLLINRSNGGQTVAVPVGGFVPSGTSFTGALAVGTSAGGSYTVIDGSLSLSLGARSGLLLVTGNIDIQPPPVVAGLHVTNEGSERVSLAWDSANGAIGYNLYRSPVSGGGYVKVNGSPLSGTSFTDTGLRNATTYHYVVTALDDAGNESVPSNEVSAIPRLAIGWANLQWPPAMSHTISAVARTPNAYGQVWIDGATSQAGATPGLRAQLGFGPAGSNPDGDVAWTWVEASFNVDAGNNDEFVASLLPDSVGTFDYAYRYTTTNGANWLYADLDGTGNGYSPDQAGKLTVTSSGDTTAPASPANFRVVSAAPAGIELAWDAVADASLYGYEVLRSSTAGGPYSVVALVTGTTYSDTSVVQLATYYYVARAVDDSFNRSGYSDEVSATADARTVALTFNVTVPSSTDATGRSVYIAGFLDRLDGGLPQWDPGGVVLTRVDATHWSITLSGKEGVQIEYKYTLGSWDYVEKDAACGEIANRQLTLSYGTSGTQTVNDTVPNWRNVAPCGI